jgi:asparagine synthase (glutamine-hydrolysing)
MAFFGEGLADVDSPEYSHAIRWRNTRRTRRFFSDELLETLAQNPPGENQGIDYPPEFGQWGPLERSQYLEITIFLSHYLLCSQGDRMAMAHSVEGRFPFLDYRVVEFCSRLPSDLKLRGLTEKYLLKKLGERWLPEEIWQRPKRPYRAPIQRSFFSESPPDYLHELLSPRQLKATGWFNPAAVTRLVRKIESGAPIGETDDMALAGIISTQLLHHQFVSNFKMPAPVCRSEEVKVCVGRDLGP